MVSQQDLHYEIRDVADPEGGLVLELWADGRRIATARTHADVLVQMEEQLGVDPSSIRATLEGALVGQLKHQLPKVEIDQLKPVVPGELRFVARYTYRDFDDIETGLVWYDVPRGATSPDALPAVVRNQMRFEVHRALTDQSPKARGIVDLLR